MVRIALVGTDHSAPAYAKRVEEVDELELVGVATGLEGEQRSESLNPTHTSYRALYEESDVDGVVICSSPAHSRDPVVAAAQQGIAVLRPGRLAETVADGEAIVDAIESADIVALGGYADSFAPERVTAVQRASSGALGSIGNVRLFRQRSASSHTLGTGGLLGPDVEFLRLLGGEVAHVFGRRTTPRSGTGMLATLRLVDDVVGQLDVRQGPGAERRQFEVSGTDGLIEFDTDDVAPVTLRQGEAESTEVPLDADAIARQLRAFHDCITEDDVPRITLRDACSTLRACLAIDASATQGTRVQPNEVRA